jgi:quercetin dioxygenase-like cupin family protein
MWNFPEFINKLPELDIDLPGVSGQILQGETHQVVFIRFDQDVEVPEHSHRSQWELVVNGEVLLRMKGEEQVYTVGQRFFVPDGVPHSASVKAGFRSVVFFDQVDRYSARK